MPGNRELRRRSGLIGHHGVWPRRLLKVWQGWDAMALEVTFFHPDDRGESTFEVSLPSWPWRPFCWLGGHQSSSYGYCVICRKLEKTA
jgi:hypothetical protein